MKIVEPESPSAATTRELVLWETAYKVDIPLDLQSIFNMSDGPLYEWPDTLVRIKIYGCRESCATYNKYKFDEICSDAIPLAHDSKFMAVYKKEENKVIGVYIMPISRIGWEYAKYACQQLDELLKAGESLGHWYGR
ncbi:hypothetical protein [Microbulbifer sp. YPW16]|uniref:hypothetical protein n=1 Tax=Microbulbifer sp. YPW16 TaxID=2904242 RepID=UPI001E555621|nr:hypothetical protein [Microbulbifer sp. YPW16]UHQ54980.1 hypothetical protein LVE68_15950 [Microbulbifer sp. YPW16]